MASENENPNSANDFSIVKRFSVANTVLWLFALYLPSVFLGIVFGIYTTTDPTITDANAWFADGDVISLFSIFLAVLTLPVVALALKKMQFKQKYQFLRLSTEFCWHNFKPWALLTLVYLTFWWVFNAIFGIETPQIMLDLLATTDNVWLLFIAICIFAPIIEEIVFRGFLFSRLQYSILGKSGAVLATSIIFTMIHSQYQGIELVSLFSLALLLAMVRVKTNNLNYCIAIHSINNFVSLVALYW
jgi:membrane protease YdiL (CAAX protease family)